MKETTILNRISNLVENMNYESAYIEIKTKNDKYIIEKEKSTRTIRIQRVGEVSGKV